VTWALRSDHADIDASWWRDVTEANVKTMTEEERIAIIEIGSNGFCIYVALHVIRGKDHDDIGFLASNYWGDYSHAIGFSFGTTL
jgi:hypothetical protein